MCVFRQMTVPANFYNVYVCMNTVIPLFSIPGIASNVYYKATAKQEVQ